MATSRERRFPSRYESTGKVLEGGLGRVYICKDKNLERAVAIKFIQNPEYINQILIEIKALQTLRSKHVVEIYDVIRSQDSSDLGIVLEYIFGDDLVSLVPSKSRAPIEAAALMKILYQLASGIADIHASGLIHRDIKLGNVKINSEGVVTIFDFGFAKSDEDSATAGFKGTFGYAAPELYTHPSQLSQAVDIYAFGICAWYLASGELTAELCAIPPGENLSALGEIRRDLPRPVTDLLTKCVATKATERPKMAGVVSLLGNYLLQGRHRGIIGGFLDPNRKRYLVHNEARGVKLTLAELGEATIKYDELKFTIELVKGDVFINNRKLTGSMILPTASVIVFGGSDLGPARQSFTFDISHPEVVI